MEDHPAFPFVLAHVHVHLYPHLKEKLQPYHDVTQGHILAFFANSLCNHLVQNSAKTDWNGPATQNAVFWEYTVAPKWHAQKDNLLKALQETLVKTGHQILDLDKHLRKSLEKQ